MKVILGADHAGFALKEHLKKYLSAKGYDVIDLGATVLKPRDDYPDYAARVAKRVVKHNEPGILVCGSSEGVCIAANKFKGIRAVSAWSKKVAKLSREHDNANILCLSGWLLSKEKASGIADTFLSTAFSKEPRHVRRLKKIEKLEQ
ncbi:RpiB/LacA/LacB family sugar-phosphate isomerase [Candidatus Woesearchaeota archaeon]|nr:RpiB/LacA/LacB family sugar-phosphate isomerase [Candidatus Woesearchaeota archaeon]